jgi:bifunctional enzyme CysN/CysC
MTEKNVVWHHSSVRREMRPQKGGTIWFTGLPGSGKSTLAHLVEFDLVRQGRMAYVLDGDNLRHGINADLGFSPADRDENVRRAGQLAHLMADAGVIALVSLVSPYREARNKARALHEADGIPFGEVYVAVTVEECAARDPKGLYARALRGEIKGMTGVDDPYEEPDEPDLRVKPGMEERCKERVLELLAAKGVL